METILILHGWPSSSGKWRRVKELLEKEGVRVFTPDLPGFGKTPPPSQAWSVGDYANWVKDFCEKNNLSQFFLLGHSFGGGVAVKFINSFPGCAKSLILVSPAILRRKTFKKYIFLILAKTGKLIFSLPVLSLLKPLTERVFYLFLGRRTNSEERINKFLSMKETFKKVVQEDLTYCLLSIKIPTLIIWGDKDLLTPIKEASIVKKGIENSELDIIKGARHGLNLEIPEILSEKILNFIEK